MSSPNTFVDPEQYPLTFLSEDRKRIIAYGQTGFPVSFIFDENPRPAHMISLVAKQSGVYYTSKDPYTDPLIIQNPTNNNFLVELYADNRDIRFASFVLRVPKSGGGYRMFSGGSLMEIRQPQQSTDAYFSFSMTPSTQLFNAYKYSGSNYYPTATLYLSFYPHLENDSGSWPSILLPDKTSTNVLLARQQSYGILDVTAEVRIAWYTNPQRTVPSPVIPFSKVDTIYGLRAYITSGSKFLYRSNVTAEGAGIVEDVYPTSYMNIIGDPPLEIYYWGGGELRTDTFRSSETGIAVSDNGLLIQSGSEVAAYVLNNPLVDIYTSSSSSESSTAERSTSTLSSTLQMSTSSVSSSSTVALPSSSSSSTAILSSSSSSSSLSSETSISSLTSSSSSTIAMSTTSSSSIGSVSSFSDQPFLHYELDDEPINRIVNDNSGNGRAAELGLLYGSLTPPIWGGSYGVRNGGLLFQANSGTSSYMFCPSWTELVNSTRGAISLWIKANSGGNLISIPMCVSNGFETIKTEMAISVNLNPSAMRIEVSLIISGNTRWKIRSGSMTIVRDKWTNVVISHNGWEPTLYLDGSEDSEYVVKSGKSDWMTAMFNSSKPPDRVYWGGAPRYYQPLIALGFNGYIDEIKMWNVPLTDIYIQELFEEGLSSSSSS